MSLSSLAEAVLRDDRVQRMVAGLTAAAVLRDIPAITPHEEPPTVSWSYALRIAGVLCGVREEPAADAALRIAQGCLASTDAGPEARRAAAVLLERMGNRRALALAERRGMVVNAEEWMRAPVPVKLDLIRGRLELTIPMIDGRLLAVNPFQREFWSAASSRTWVSVSAPTSAGKSFIVRTWIAEQARKADRFRAAYVVPTRALIDEVSTDLQAELATNVAVRTLPWDPDLGSADREVYVMTQERVHLLLAKMPTLVLDLLFVDEAQKFGDDERGVLLQQVVDESVRRSSVNQVMLASPLAANPELLLEGAPARDPLPLALMGRTVTVNQDLLWCAQVPRKPKHWTIDLVTGGVPAPLGTFELPASPEPRSKRLPLVAVALGGLSPGTVVYVNRPSDAETAALQIYDALGDVADIVHDPDVAALRDLVRRTIHNSYALSVVLARGVAFHYGSMPQLVRQEVERLFREEKLRYLVCTSTLLEGVNLPCRLLVARKPQKGTGKPMSAGDFWNLAGRAGRWGKEFQGNIVCVDAANPREWPDPPLKRELQTLKRAADPSLRDVRDLVSYLEAGAPAEWARAAPMLEAVVSMLSTRLLSAGSLQGLPALSPNDVPTLEDAVTHAIGDAPLPQEMLLRHAGISPPALARLDAVFRAAPALDRFILPGAGDEDPLPAYTAALSVCHHVIGADFGNDRRQYVVALLITDWMRGLPLAVIIEKRLRWLRANRPKFTLATEIRGVMRDVETVARFQAPKYLGCYVDVLAWHLRSNGLETEADELPDVTMMLEMGVSRTTEISLMSLGLSRTSVVALSEFIAEGTLTRDQSRQWLLDRDLDAFPLPALVREEVRRRVRE